VEKMDSVTLAVICDKCVKEGIDDEEMWSKFSWRAQQLSCRMHEPDLCYLFRAFARADWFDQNLLTTYLGRLHRRLPMFHLADVTVLLEAFANPRFRQSMYLEKALNHLSLLIQHRDDASVQELAKVCIALQSLHPLPLQSSLESEVHAILELVAEALLLRELSELSSTQTIGTLGCLVTYHLVGRERSRQERVATAALDLSWTLVRQLRGQLHALSKEAEGPDELGQLAMWLQEAGLSDSKLWEELAVNLSFEAHRLSAPGVATASSAIARVVGRAGALGQYGSRHQLCENLMRQIAEQLHNMTSSEYAHALHGALSITRIGVKAVHLRKVVERAVELGPNAFDNHATVTVLDALRNADLDKDDASTRQSLAIFCDALLEKIYDGLDSMEDLSPRSTVSLVRSTTSFNTEMAKKLLPSLLSRVENSADHLTPRDFGMLFQSLASIEGGGQMCADRMQPLLSALQQALIAVQPHPATTVQLLGSLSICPATELRNTVLTELCDELQSGANDLTARELQLLGESLLSLESAEGEVQWKCPPALLSKLVSLIDMKRYDLHPKQLDYTVQVLSALRADVSKL